MDALVPTSSDLALRTRLLGVHLVGSVGTAIAYFRFVAKAPGLTQIAFYFVAAATVAFLFAVPAIIGANAKGWPKIVSVALAGWLLVSAWMFTAANTRWPARGVFLLHKEDMERLRQQASDNLRNGVTATHRVGPYRVVEIRSLSDGGVFLNTGNGTPGSPHGFLYCPEDKGNGLSLWSKYRLSKKWFVVEQE